jgi:hypothetical protein
MTWVIQGWHFGISPYLWFAGVQGTVGALGHEASVHVKMPFPH